jgi:hypothetical protein
MFHFERTLLYIYIYLYVYIYIHIYIYILEYLCRMFVLIYVIISLVKHIDIILHYRLVKTKNRYASISAILTSYFILTAARSEKKDKCLLVVCLLSFNLYSYAHSWVDRSFRQYTHTYTH